MSGRKFSVGDRVRIVRSDKPGKVGMISIVMALYVHKNINPKTSWYNKIPAGTEMCILDIRSEHPGMKVGYPHDHLEPVYDGNEKISWTDCVWKPKARILG